MTISDEDRPDAPLDPAMERVRRKMIRLLAVSIGIMFAGVIAVLLAVVYRASQGDGTPEPAAGSGLPAGGSAAIALPAGARVRDVSLDGGRALLRVAFGSGEELLLVDLATGAVLSRYPLAAR